MNKPIQKIPINIWVDYFESDSDIKDTYAYVDDYDIQDSDCKEYLSEVLLLLKDLNYNCELVYHDSRNDYDEETVNRFIKDYGEIFFFKQYKILFKKITIKDVNYLVNYLNNLNTRYEFYNES